MKSLLQTTRKAEDPLNRADKSDENFIFRWSCSGPHFTDNANNRMLPLHILKENFFCFQWCEQYIWFKENSWALDAQGWDTFSRTLHFDLLNGHGSRPFNVLTISFLSISSVFDGFPAVLHEPSSLPFQRGEGKLVIGHFPTAVTLPAMTLAGIRRRLDHNKEVIVIGYIFRLWGSWEMVGATSGTSPLSPERSRRVASPKRANERLADWVAYAGCSELRRALVFVSGAVFAGVWFVELFVAQSQAQYTLRRGG